MYTSKGIWEKVEWPNVNFIAVPSSFDLGLGKANVYF